MKDTIVPEVLVGKGQEICLSQSNVNIKLSKKLIDTQHVTLIYTPPIPRFMKWYTKIIEVVKALQSQSCQRKLKISIIKEGFPEDYSVVHKRHYSNAPNFFETE